MVRLSIAEATGIKAFTVALLLLAICRYNPVKSQALAQYRSAACGPPATCLLAVLCVRTTQVDRIAHCAAALAAAPTAASTRLICRRSCAAQHDMYKSTQSTGPNTCVTAHAWWLHWLATNVTNELPEGSTGSQIAAEPLLGLLVAAFHC